MTIGTRISNATGVVQTNNTTGLSVEKNTTNVGFAPFKVDSVTAITASTTLVAGNAGVITLSGSTTALTGTMPLASAAPGAFFTFRNLNASLGHQLTASAETGGTKPFTDGYTRGAKLAIGSGVGGAVTFMCDGVNFLILGGTSGSFGTVSPGAGSLYTISS